MTSTTKRHADVLRHHSLSATISGSSLGFGPYVGVTLIAFPVNPAGVEFLMGNTSRRFIAALALLFLLIILNANSAFATRIGNVTVRLEVGILTVHARNGEPNSSLIGLRHLLDEIGVPYRLIDPALLINRGLGASPPALITDSYLATGTLTANELSAIKQYVEEGGTIMAVKPEGTIHAKIFGFRSRLVSNRSFFLKWRTEALSGKLVSYLNQPEERLIQLASRQDVNSSFLTTVFAPSTAEPLADFLDPDGGMVGPAIVRNKFGLGLAYALGIGWADSILRFEMNRDYLSSIKSATNVWRPNADVMRLFVLGVLSSEVPSMVFMHAVPFGYRSALLLSHDVDTRTAYDEFSLDMAEMETSLGVKATYFLTTRYFRDKIDKAYWNPQTVERLLSLGMTIGSHTVSHYENFTELPVGTGNETQASYIPSSPASLSGEIRVSAEMLRSYAPVVSWRSAGLLNHRYLTFYLQENGYEFKNVYTAATVGTNFPYVAMLNQSSIHESSVFEFPLALGDIGLNETNRESFVDLWKEVIRNNRDNGAPTSILVHPTSKAKVEATKEIVEWALLEGDIWVADWESYMRFWKLRHNMAIEIQYSNNAYTMRLTNPQSSMLEGLSLMLPWLEAPLQIPLLLANKNFTLVLSLAKSRDLAVLQATQEIDRAAAAIEGLEAQGLLTASGSSELALAKEEFAQATHISQTSPQQALRHARIALAHTILAGAAELETQNWQPEQEPIGPTALSEEGLGAIDIVLIIVVLVVYGIVLLKGRMLRKAYG